MSVTVIEIELCPTMEPVTCQRKLHEVPVAGIPLGDRIRDRIADAAGDTTLTLSAKANLWPSWALVHLLAETPTLVVNKSGEQLAWSSTDGQPPRDVEPRGLDQESFEVKYPWHILDISEALIAELSDSTIIGTVREGVVIDGHIELGEGSVLLPGVYVEGNAIIGKNCKVGPNCYIRGNTYIGDGCHVGQSVEVKNSLLMDKVSAGHLSYIGDSIICPHTNLGAGTITANFRHDGKSHRTMVGDDLLDTGRRKFGMICGDNVHTGINTSVYPGRKIWPGMSTLPGAVVQRDIK